MAQLRYCMKWLVANIADNYNHNRPFKFCKLDIKDSFWRLVVIAEDVWNFCYVLPNKDGTIPDNIDDTNIVVPHSLQMGWCKSPAFFCASLETSWDVIHSLLENNINLPQHPLEHHMLPITYGPEPAPEDTTTTTTEGFVDNFIGATNDLSSANLLKTSRAVLHGIESVYPCHP
eukprot:14658148-Ditylum_brightwellii.AAC.1